MKPQIEGKSLFAINDELLILINEIEEAGGEVTPEQEESLQIRREELKVKSLNYVHVIKKLESDLELVKVYKDQLDAFKKRKERMIERLKSSLLFAVENFGDIEADIFKITTRKSESVEILDAEKIQSDFLRTKVVTEIDKVKIKSAIKAGVEVAGAALVENKNLSIK